MANQFISPEGDLENIFVSNYEMIDQYSQLGTLWLWGYNQYSQLGDNTFTNRSSPVQTVSGGTNWRLVNSGWYHTTAIKTDGTLWLWGRNDNGGLGDNSRTRRSSPVQTVAAGTNWRLVSGGYYHTAAIKTDGTLWTWGRGSDGQLGDNTIASKSSPVQTVSGGTNWKFVSAAADYTMAIKTDGTLWTWGYNGNGQLGDNTFTNRSSPVQTVAGGSTWKSVNGFQHHTAGIKTDGTLWLWGLNGYGQLGDNSITVRTSPVQTVSGGSTWKSVVCGLRATAAIKTNGQLWTWGVGSDGSLGNNAITHRSSPVQTVAGGTNWKSVDAGHILMAAIKTDGTLWAWGSNGVGQNGDNSTTKRSSPVQTVAGGTNWRSVSCGVYNTAATKNTRF